MSKTVDLGPVSAYALAVKYGYAGTEAEWVAEMESKRLEAMTAASNAQSAATEASQSNTESANSATASADSATASANSASAASDSATLAESYTHGGTGTREGEDTDNARYYMDQAKAVSAVDIMTVNKAGIGKPDGTTITVDEDGTLHGNSEVTVDSELSKESENPVQNKTVAEELEKKLNSDGDSKDLTTTFTSNDSTNVTEWTDVGLLTSGEKHSSLFQKVATMFKNIRYLYHMLGTADISTLGEGANIGTVTGAISKLNSDLDNLESENNKLFFTTVVSPAGSTDGILIVDTPFTNIDINKTVVIASLSTYDDQMMNSGFTVFAHMYNSTQILVRYKYGFSPSYSPVISLMVKNN